MDDKPFTDAVAWLQNMLETSHDEITYICLGPLSTLAAVLDNHNHTWIQKYTGSYGTMNP